MVKNAKCDYCNRDAQYFSSKGDKLCEHCWNRKKVRDIIAPTTVSLLQLDNEINPNKYLNKRREKFEDIGVLRKEKLIHDNGRELF